MAACAVGGAMVMAWQAIVAIVNVRANIAMGFLDISRSPEIMRSFAPADRGAGIGQVTIS